jgi:hypothetical protein
MMETIYRGEIASCEGVVYGIEIQKETDGTAAEVAALSFPAEEPLVIEWGERSKEEVTCGSTATLTLLSPGDRTYLGLYTVEAGSVRLNVYRDGALYWSGTLDTEFYEEPYATAADYAVTLTFSDFGILDRLKYAGTGIENCWELVERIITAVGFLYTDLKELCATRVEADGAAGIEELTVRADNFYDEEGEASTLKEVLEGVLQPLGLRVVQHAGAVYVYDLESAYREMPREVVKWMSDDQTLGVDKVVNNVEIDLSTYASEEVLTGEMDYPGTVDTGSTETEHSNAGRKWSYYADLNRTGEVQFTLYTTDSWDFKGRPGLAQVGPSKSELGDGVTVGVSSLPRWAHIDPLYGGEETDCVAIYWRTDVGGTKKAATYYERGVRVAAPNVGFMYAEVEVNGERTVEAIVINNEPGTLVYRSYQGYLGQLSEPERYLLRVKIEMRLDTRYNPFGTGDDNLKALSEKIEACVQTMEMPGKIQLKDAEGNVLMYLATGIHYYQWFEGADPTTSVTFSWRNLTDGTQTALNVWMTNVHYNTRNLGSYVESEAAGTVIPYPPKAGYLEVELYSGVRLYHRRDSGVHEDAWIHQSKLVNSDSFWWHLVKAPVVTLVNNDAKMTEVNTDDVTYTGELNASAKEDLKLETVCGTLERENAASRAVYLSAATGMPLQELTRAGRTTTAEQLLIGTLYSQFADRKLKLTGTVALTDAPFGLRREASAGEVDFLVAGEVQDVQADTTEVTMVELRPDEYEESED